MTRHVLVTGGASGLGLGCALRFARLGDTVTLADVNEAAGRDALRALERAAPGVPLRLEPMDLSDPASIRAMAGRLRRGGAPRSGVPGGRPRPWPRPTEEHRVEPWSPAGTRPSPRRSEPGLTSESRAL